MGQRPLTDSGASPAGRALSFGPGRSRPRPAPRTFGFQSPQPLGGARSRVGGPEEEEAAQDEEAVPRALARGRAELACAPALGAGGRAASPQPPRRRLDWRLPRARLRGGRGGGRADCGPGGRRSRPAPEQGGRGGRLVRAKRDMARRLSSPGGPVGMVKHYRRGDVTFEPPGR
ncbi:translation initiation factor IF-2-like [Peromyscus leucopus]|uniref:translation initiation factor IF-2-like n=1 Tax=Peromyscus leucopus TaxID=10041 RepID=UPI001885620F|nr:translation initiation factor IF-2-like [Peromyscus leucopus]